MWGTMPEEEEFLDDELSQSGENDDSEEGDYPEFGGEEEMEMEPDESLEPVGEQSPNTREAFEEEEEEETLLDEI